MKKTVALLFSGIFTLCACETLETGLALLSGGGGQMNVETIAAGLKEALSQGTDRATARLSKDGGYSSDPALKIPLPGELAKFAETLRGIGLGSQVDELELRMNQGAEKAAKTAAPVFLDAIRGMSFEDAKGILSGGDTAATDFFRSKTSGELKKMYLPAIRSQLDQVGAARLYSSLLDRYNRIPLVPPAPQSMEDYVADKALQGLFAVIAEEEKKIRHEPAARTSALLKQVFGE